MQKKIALADDDEEIVSLLKTTLELAGYSVAATTFGSFIPKLIEAEKPDLLIMDVLMPGMDGYSLQLQLAENEATKNLPVIVMTALPASRTLFEQFEQVKMFLNKPFDVEDLLARIREILGEEE